MNFLSATMLRGAEISFPMLGDWSVNPPYSFTVFGFEIYFYGVIIAAAFILAALFCARKAAEFGLTSDDLFDLVIWLIPACIIGARLYYVLFKLDYFIANPSKIFSVRDGGLAIYGGIIAGTLIAYLVARYKKIPFPALADLCAFGLLIGQIAGRWGNFVNAEAYGSETTLPWRMGIQGTVDGVQRYMEVHPTFLYESLWNLVGFCLLLWVLHKGLRKFDGMMFLLYVAWYGFGRGLIEGLRTDSLYFFSTGIRTSQMVGFVSCAVAVILLVWNLRRHPDPQNLYVNRINKNGEETK